jgi:hypothetical protein
VPVTQGDYVPWQAVVNAAALNPLDPAEGAGYGQAPNVNNFKSALANAGWRNVFVIAAGTLLTLTAYAPQTWPTSTEVGNYFQSVAQGAGLNVVSWSIKSAGDDWFKAHPEDKPKDNNSSNIGTYALIGGALLVLMILMRD